MNWTRLLLVGAAVLAGWFITGPTTAVAEPGSGSTDELIDDFSGEESSADANAPLSDSGVEPVNLELAWQTWRDSLSGRPAFEALTQLRRDATSLGRPNLPTYSLALVHQLRSATIGAEHASRVFDKAVAMSPDLPEPRLAQAWHILRRNPAGAARAARRLSEGIARGLAWPDTRTVWLLNLSLLGLLGLAGALAVTSLGQIFRQLPVVANDLRRLLPDFISRNQILVLLVGGSLAVGIWRASPLAVALLLLAFASWPQRPTERLGTATVAGLLALLPSIDAGLSNWSSFPDSEAQQLLHAQYFGCDQACRGRLSDRDLDATGRYTLALAEMRTGAPSAIDRAVRRLRDGDFDGPLAPWADNLIGAGLIAAGNPAAAVAPLAAASSALPDGVAPPFNLGQAHRRLDHDEKADAAFARATDRDVDAVRHRQDDDAHADAPSQLMLPALPAGHFLDRHRTGGNPAASVVGPTWRQIAGPARPLGEAPWLGLALFVVIALGVPLQSTGRTSTPCPRCGLAREPDDPAKTGGSPQCLPCYRTSVGSAEMGYRERVYRETYLGRRETLQRWLRHGLTLLAPGAGHALAGHAISGLLLSLVTCLAGLLLVVPTLAGRGPDALFWQDWLGLQILGGFLVAIAAVVVVLTLHSGLEPWRDSYSDSS